MALLLRMLHRQLLPLLLTLDSWIMEAAQPLDVRASKSRTKTISSSDRAIGIGSRHVQLSLRLQTYARRYVKSQVGSGGNTYLYPAHALA